MRRITGIPGHGELFYELCRSPRDYGAGLCRSRKQRQSQPEGWAAKSTVPSWRAASSVAANAGRMSMRQNRIKTTY